MKEFARHKRVEQEIMRSLALIIQRNISDKRLGFTMVNSVQMTRDLSIAKVYISFLKDETSDLEKIKILDKAKGYINLELGKKINLREMPKLLFVLDKTQEQGAKIESLLKDVNNKTKS